MQTIILALLCYLVDEGRKSDDYPVHSHLEKVLNQVSMDSVQSLPLAEKLDA